ncbi:MAG: RICIN domain-containing protein [Ruminococcus sp.]|nr:RICIN domain-containing protein [Ruminococcus sp.]
MNRKILYEVPEKRDRCIKHFRMADKGMVAAVYPSPVHYKEGGEWKEIDNRLEEVEKEGKKGFQNKASAVKVRFAEIPGEGELVTVEKDGMHLAWKLEGAGAETDTQIVDTGTEFQNTQSVDAEEEFNDTQNVDTKAGSGHTTAEKRRSFKILQREEQEELLEEANEETGSISDSGKSEKLDDKEFRQRMKIPNWNSDGIYEEILPGVDLQYTIQGERIKENIYLHSKDAASQPLVFLFTHPGLMMKKEEDGSYGLFCIEENEAGEKKDQEAVFHLAKPYMYDAAGVYSQQIELKAEFMDGKSRITVEPDTEWLMSEERVYPVTIDPMTETSKTRANIEDTYVFSGGTSTDASQSVYAYGSFPVGKSDALGKIRAYLRFRNLPDIGKGSIIYAAMMYIWQYEYSSYGTEKIPLLAYEVKGDWNEETVRWSSQPAIDSNVLDYKEVGQVLNGNVITITPIGFDVTRLVRQWYNTGNNYGIMLRSEYEDSSVEANKAYASFYASDNPQLSTDQYPSGMFYYRNVNGLEDYQSYHEQSAGRAGTGYTNDFTGNLVWIHPDAQTTGGPMQAQIRHIYNSSEAGTSSRAGYGWTLSGLEKLEKSGMEAHPYVYTDADSTKHYFYRDETDENKLKDEDGLGFVITSEEGASIMTMETKDKRVYTFGTDGFIRSITDLDGYQILYRYGVKDSLLYLDNIRDSTGAFLKIVYRDNSTLSRIEAIRDAAGRFTTYGYDANGNLAVITYPDGKKTSFTYDEGHRLLRAKNPDGYSISYEYTEDFRVPRVSKITEKGSDGQIGRELKIFYENGNTTIFEEPGLDGELTETGDNKKTTFHFDNMGRPTSVQDSDEFANTYEYYTSGMKNHKLSKDGSVQKTVYGLLKNHCFFRDGEWYTCRILDGQTGDVERTDGYLGLKCAKLQKTDAGSEEGICQDITLSAGTYTLSAYVKTEAMASGSGAEEGAGLMVIRSDQTKIKGERFIDYITDPKIDDGWERLMVTFQLAASETVKIFAGMLGMTGTFYVTGVQLEEGSAANKLNLVENAGFEYHTNEVPDNWKYSANITDVKSTVTSEKGRCAVLNGKRTEGMYMAQTIEVSGEEGDIYNLSCRAKGIGIPGKRFAISARFNYEDGTEEDHYIDGNPNISGWQFLSGTFRAGNGEKTTKKKFVSIKIHAEWHSQINQALFEGFQLVKDDGGSYVYDEGGNLASAVSAAEKSHFVYDKKGSLTRMGKIDGTEFEYGYDSKGHLTRAASSEKVRYTFEYDEKGQPIAMRAEGGKHLGAAVPGRVYYIREKYSGNYLSVKNGASANGTAVQLDAFTGSASQKWMVTDCLNGYVQLEPQHASGICLDMKDASIADGTAIQVYELNGTDAQRWKLHPKQDGSYQISNKGTSDKKGLSNYARNTASGQAVLNYTLADENVYQDWYFEPADEGKISAEPAPGKIVSIRVRNSGQYVDVADMLTSVGSRAMQFYYNGGKNQQFRLLPVDDTYYQLEPLHAPGMVLAKYGTNDRGLDRLALDVKTTGAAHQMFRFEEIEAGKGTGYAIICKDENKAFDVIDYSYARSADIILTLHEGIQVNKWWILEEVSEQIESSMTYTSDGRNVASVTDARGNRVQYEYDENNRLLTKVLDAKENATSYTYDVNTDDLTEIKRSVDGEEAKVQYTYENDRISSIVHNGFTYNFAYDTYGNRKSVSVGENELIHTEYRNKNGLTDRITYATGESIRNAYDPKEQLSSQYLVKADGTEEKLFTNTYDTCGNVIKHEDHRNGIVSHGQFDMIGRSLGLDFSDGLKLRTQYDEKNRVKALVQKIDDSLVKTEYVYGDVEKQEKPGLFYGLKVNGTKWAAYTHDTLARLRKKTLLFTDGAYETVYDYLSGANAGTTTTLLSSVTNGEEKLSYTYDVLGNIQTISENGVLKCTFCYDELNRLIREDNVWENKTICYAYDLGGNLLSWKEYAYTTAAISSTATPTKQNTYAYTNTDWKDQLTAYNGQAITYDALGNPLSYRGMAMTWEKGRELKQLVKDGSTITFAYDTAGKRIGKTAGGVATKYYWNGDKIIGLKKGSDLLHFVYDEKGSLFAMQLNGEIYHYVFNVQNDVIGLIDSTGNKVVSYTYNSWGKLLGMVDSTTDGVGSKNPFRYRGYCWDEETGLYYVGSRYYDPAVGRFISPDTTDILGVDSDLYDKNLYAYCDNNPVMRKDSSGELWIAAVAVGVATQYAGDVIGNLLAGKTGVDIFTPTSSIGEYVAAGVTALIPGSGISGNLVRNIATEAIVSVERHVTGKGNNLKSSVTNVVRGTLIDTGVEVVSNRVTKYVRTKTSKTYSQKAKTMRQKNSNVSTSTIRTSAQRSVRWGNRLAKGIEFVFNSIRSALPW